MSANSLKTDPLLLAQQYLLGELSGPEVEAFEERLADDVVLAEALADVVLLHGSLTRAPDPMVPARSQKMNRRIRQFWWGAAAVLVVAVTLSQLPSTGPKESMVQSDPLNVARPEVYEALFDRDEDDSVAVEPAYVESDDSAALDVPDWMVAAVEAAGQGAQEPGQPREEEL